jgi:hypothetical protein
MSFDILPDLVLDEIVSYLSYTDLLSSSQSCKALNAFSNRYIYRTIDPKTSKNEKRLRQSLQHNPHNAQYIHSYVSYDPHHLRSIWSKPLHLRKLRIKWVIDANYRNPYPRCLSGRHKDVSVQELHFKLNYHRAGYILNRLETFNGLEKITIRMVNFPSRSEYTLQRIIEMVKCPSLRHLRIEDGNEITVSLGPHLPNLIGLELKPGVLNDVSMLRGKEECWDTLSSMMNRQVFYRVARGGCKVCGPDLSISFYDVILNYAALNNLNAASVIKWLARSEAHYNTVNDIAGIDLTGTTLKNVPKVWEIIQSSNMTTEMSIRLHLGISAIRDTLFLGVSHLVLTVPKPAILPMDGISTMLHAHSTLRKLTFRLRGYRNIMHQYEDTPFSNFQICLDRQFLRIDLSMRQGGKSSWSIYGVAGELDTLPSNFTMVREEKFKRALAGVALWFEWCPTLETAEIIFLYH